MYNNLGIPSMYAHILTGSLVFTAVVFVIWNITKLQGIETYKKLIIVLLLSISVGVHGLSHLGLEQSYHYNPLQYGRCPQSDNCPYKKCQKQVRFAV
jgi:hypothetical protein